MAAVAVYAADLHDIEVEREEDIYRLRSSAWFDSNPVQQLHVGTMDFYPGKAAKYLPLPVRMGIESVLETIPLLNRYGGKVAAWGVK